MRSIVVTFVTALLLAGCSPQSAQFFSAGSSEYDGAWVGRFQVSVRTEECEVARGGLQARISGGQIQGTARFRGSRNLGFSGVVEEGGGLKGGVIKLPLDRSIEIQGKFTEKTAGGRWSNRECHGTWDLRKIR